MKEIIPDRNLCLVMAGNAYMGVESTVAVNLNDPCSSGLSIHNFMADEPNARVQTLSIDDISGIVLICHDNFMMFIAD